MSPREPRRRTAGNPRRAVAIPERARGRLSPSPRAPAACSAIEEKASDRRVCESDCRPPASSGGLFVGSAARGALRQMRGLKALVINPGKVEGIADPKIVIILRRLSTAIPEMREKGPFGIDLAGNAELEHRLRVVDRMDVHVAEALALEVLIVDDFPEEGERAELFEQAGIECDLVQSVLNVSCRLRNIRAVERVDLDQDDVAGIAFVDEREEGRITHVTAIPISLSVDFDGFEHEWQTSRRHDAVEPNLGLPENLRLAGADIGRCQKNFEPLRVVDRVEVDALTDDVAQGVEVHRIGIIRRKDP